MFRFKSSVPVSYDWQGYIYFKSRLYQELPQRDRDTILNMCLECGGEYYEALFDFVTTGMGAVHVCEKHHLSRSTLERVVRKYYQKFPRE